MPLSSSIKALKIWAFCRSLSFISIIMGIPLSLFLFFSDSKSVTFLSTVLIIILSVFLLCVLVYIFFVIKYRTIYKRQFVYKNNSSPVYEALGLTQIGKNSIGMVCRHCRKTIPLAIVNKAVMAGSLSSTATISYMNSNRSRNSLNLQPGICPYCNGEFI
jgi:hypothetical protein